MAKKPKPKANSATSPALFESSGWHNEHDLEFDYYFDPFNDGLVSAGEAEYLHSIGYHSLANSKHLNAAQTFFKYANGFEESGSAEDMHYNLFLSAEQYWKCKNFRMAHEMAEKINPRELPIRQQIPILFAQLIDSDAGGNAPKQPDVGGNVPKQPNVSPRAANLFPIINESYKDSIPCPKAPSQLCPGDKFEFALPDGTPIAFSWCPPGTFAMGSDDANHNERPAHKVTITKGFFVSTTPITLRQWNSVMGSELTSHAESLMRKYATPGTDISLFISEERPVQRVNLADCNKYIERLCLITGMKFRLPYEAEWEYACRAGTTTEYSYGDQPNSDFMNYNGYCLWNGSGYGKFLKHITPVGSFPPNAWGLYDFHGNVCEWCQDRFDTKYYKRSPSIDPTGPTSDSTIHVYRGGSWRNIPHLCRSATRYGHHWSERRIELGFRIVLALG